MRNTTQARAGQKPEKEMNEKGYRQCKELKQLTSEILQNWDCAGSEDIFLIRKQTSFLCPLSNQLVSETICRSCAHNFGNASIREIYCIPEFEKKIIRDLR